jgi:hypothetical protein
LTDGQKEAQMLKSLVKFTIAAAGTAVIAAATFVSSVKLAEKVERSLDENDRKKDENKPEENPEDETEE